MKFSKLLCKTTKDAPKDATLASHKYLIRGSFVTQEGAGLYNFLPLGKIVLDKIKAIVKEELDNAGCNEVVLSVVTPNELWEKSNRASKMGKEMLRFQDRKGNDFVLSPTNEEAMVSLVDGKVNSYKDLPLNLYQINTKFRDEARPRFGLLRSREFVMKDGYSFHSTTEDMKNEYQKMYDTYTKIFTKLGLDFRAVEADSGAIGGSGSKEFMVLASSGEDDIVVCSKCEYSANIEAASKCITEKISEDISFKKGEFHTPNIKTIEELSTFFKIDKNMFVKTIAKRAVYEESSEIVLFCMQGDDELQVAKAINATAALDIVDVNEKELEEAGLVPGFMGPVSSEFKTFFDNSLNKSKELICGANKKDYHLVGINLANLDATYFDLSTVKQGDDCPKCKEALNIVKGIEVGHIFQLGDIYSKALNATFLDANGKSKFFEMGTYGIGVTRLLSAIIESSHDEKGCIWSDVTAPFKLDIIVSDIKKEEQLGFATSLYEKLKQENVDVILDDRKERFGFKMKDFELIGFSYALIVGKSLADGKVELVDRKTLKKEEINLDDLEEVLKSI